MHSNLPRCVYLSADDVVRLVQRAGLSHCIAGMAERIERDFLRWPDFDKSARVACHSEDGVIELMPIADSKEFAFKYVNGHPKNARQGLPTVMAFGVLADVDTGAPRLLSELTLTTAIRTAATSALAARQLARPECRVMALIVRRFEVGNRLRSEQHRARQQLEFVNADLDVGRSLAIHTLAFGRQLGDIGLRRSLPTRSA